MQPFLYRGQNPQDTKALVCCRCAKHHHLNVDLFCCKVAPTKPLHHGGTMWILMLVTCEIDCCTTWTPVFVFLNQLVKCYRNPGGTITIHIHLNLTKMRIPLVAQCLSCHIAV